MANIEAVFNAALITKATPMAMAAKSS